MGGPIKRTAIEENLAHYWTFRWELGYTDGVLYKGSKIIIPTAMRRRMLEKIHAAHQGVEKSILNAIDTMYWPSMRRDIQDACDSCPTCAQWGSKHQPEPMLHQPVPELPWQFVSQDIFHNGTRSYLVTVDHYSDFFEVDTLTDTLSSTIVLHTKKIFARHGSPMVCLTDNGPQFISAEYEQFAKDWNFHHITSSPYHSQGNGRAEAAVKAAKNILRKCHDPELALLHLRNTPTKGHQTSPAQRLMSRRTRTTVPTSTPLLKPAIMDPVIVRREKTTQHARSKYHYDKRAAPELPVLTSGDYVYVKPPPNKHNTPWIYGRVIANPSPRSYTIQTSNGVARRNRTHLRLAAPPAPPTVVPADIEVTNNSNIHHPVQTPSPCPKPIAHVPTNSPSDHERAEPQCTSPTKATAACPSPTRVCFPTTSQADAFSPLKQLDTSRQFYTTRAGRESKPPKRYEE